MSFKEIILFILGGGLMLNKNANTSIAKELVQKMQKILLKNDVKKIDLFVSSSNLKALNFYKKLDFKEKRKLLIKDING